MLRRASLVIAFCASIFCSASVLLTQQISLRGRVRDSSWHLHVSLGFLKFLLKLCDLVCFVLGRVSVALDVLLSFCESLRNSFELVFRLHYVLHLLLTLALGKPSSLFGILELCLHMVVLLGQFFDLASVVSRVLILFLLQELHVFLQLHN